MYLLKILLKDLENKRSSLAFYDKLTTKEEKEINIKKQCYYDCYTEIINIIQDILKDCGKE